MTCIVGFIDRKNNTIYIGGDSVAGNSYLIRQRTDPKVFQVGDFIMGYTTSFRMGQLLEHAFKPPVFNPDEKSLKEYMVVDFVNALRECFKDGGYSRKREEVESGGQFIVGGYGSLFYIDSDYQVADDLDGYCSVGCGEQYAYGSLFTSQNISDPSERVLLALLAAEKYSTGVKGPFTIMSMSYEDGVPTVTAEYIRKNEVLNKTLYWKKIN